MGGRLVYHTYITMMSLVHHRLDWKREGGGVVNRSVLIDLISHRGNMLSPTQL